MKKIESLTVPGAVREELETEVGKINQTLDALASFVVKDEDSLFLAGQLLTAAKGQWKSLEDRRTSVTGPMNAALKEVNSWFKPPQEGLKKAETILKEKIGTFELTQRRKHEKSMLAVAQAAQRGDVADLAVPIGMPENTSVRETWGFEIVDEDAVPRYYCSADPKKIRAYLLAELAPHSPLPDIPGLRVFKKPVVTVR